MKRWLEDLNYLLFPPLCYACETRLSPAEDNICTLCELEIAEVLPQDELDARFREVFYGKHHVQAAISLFYYEKRGVTRNLIHNLKYRNTPQISDYLGKRMAEKLSRIDHFPPVDIVIPVPVHEKRRAERGYNQVDAFAKAISKTLHAQYRVDVLIKDTHTVKQSMQKRFARVNPAENPFTLHSEASIPTGSHILLVDDVVTTGATLERCLTILQQLPEVKYSVATMAIAM